MYFEQRIAALEGGVGSRVATIQDEAAQFVALSNILQAGEMGSVSTSYLYGGTYKSS